MYCVDLCILLCIFSYQTTVRRRRSLIKLNQEMKIVTSRGWHGNGEGGNTAVTAVITAGMRDISR